MQIGLTRDYFNDRQPCFRYTANNADMRMTNCLLSKRHTVLTIALLCTGCSDRPSRMSAPEFASSAAADAIAAYDSNGDGALDAKELDAAPAIRAASSRIDTNHDNRITAAEIQKCLDTWKRSKLALMQVAVTVRFAGRPLANANVTFIPEKWLGPNIQSAHGTTDESGEASIIINSEKGKTGVQLGFYRIDISRLQGGKETIAARYNTKTELGVEVAPDAMDLQNFSIDLK
jgi:hypothetical protein